jgi:hypothetical protein
LQAKKEKLPLLVESDSEGLLDEESSDGSSEWHGYCTTRDIPHLKWPHSEEPREEDASSPVRNTWKSAGKKKKRQASPSPPQVRYEEHEREVVRNKEERDRKRAAELEVIKANRPPTPPEEVVPGVGRLVERPPLDQDNPFNGLDSDAGDA